MKIEKLYNENEFEKRVNNDARELLSKEFTKDSFKKQILREAPPLGWDHLSQREQFQISTFRATAEITSKLEALDHCVAFINSYPKTRLWGKNFSRADYIRYHLEVYYGNIVGIFDRCLLLVNHLYDLGFKPQDAKYHLISSNKHLKGEKVLEILSMFNKALQAIRSVRNYIEHQGSLSDEELDDLKMFEFIPDKVDQRVQRVISAQLRLSFGLYIREKKKEIKANNAWTVSIVDRLFTSVSKKYEHRMNSFGGSGGASPQKNSSSSKKKPAKLS